MIKVIKDFTLDTKFSIPGSDIKMNFGCVLIRNKAYKKVVIKKGTACS